MSPVGATADSTAYDFSPTAMNFVPGNGVVEVVGELRVALVRDQRAEVREAQVAGDVHRVRASPNRFSVSRYASSVHPMCFGSWPEVITLCAITVSDAM